MLRKRMISLLLSLAMLLVFMPSMVFAEDASDTGNNSDAVETEAIPEEAAAEEVTEIKDESGAENVTEEAPEDDSAEVLDPFDAQNAEAQAESAEKLNLSSSNTISLNQYEEREIARFKYDGKSIVYAYAEIVSWENLEDEETGIELDFVSDNDDEYLPGINTEDDILGFAFADFGSDIYHQFYDADYPISGLAEGEEYAIVLQNNTSKAQKIQYKVRTYDSYSDTATLPANESIDVTEDYKVISAKEADAGNKMPLIVDWETGNDNIIEVAGTESGKAWFWAKNKGNCTLTATLANGKRVTCNVTATDITIRLKETFKEMKVGSSFTQVLLNKGKGKVKWSTSNKKVATVSSKGVVKAKGPGKCKIKAKYNKITYVCEIEVYRELPDYDAYIDDYNTRSKWFVVPVTNNGELPLTIYSSGAKAIDCDYTSWDRKLKLKKGKSLTVKPGRTVNVYFKVVGRSAHPDYEDYTINYYVSYNGAKYKATVESDDVESYFYLPKGGYYFCGGDIEYYDADWYHTYNDEE